MKKELKKQINNEKNYSSFYDIIFVSIMYFVEVPDKMEINISVPEDYDIEKLEILVDTLRSQAKDKFDMQVEIGTVKKLKKEKIKNLNNAKIKPAEVSALLKKQLETADIQSSFDEVGTVLEVGDGIARVYGLTNAEYGELVSFDSGLREWY